MTLDDLLDRQSIIDATIRYCWALDTKAWAELDTVFVPEATAQLNRTTHDSRAAIVERISGTIEPLDFTQHMVSNHQVSLSGDTATSRCYLHAQHVRIGAEGGDLYVAAGHYEDRWVRTADGWRISHRHLTVVWTDGNKAVVHPQ